MNDKAYHDREMQLHFVQLQELDKLPRAEKAENAARLVECWKDYPEIFGERVHWILNGTYGYGAMIAALRIADNKRLNRVAALSQLAAAVEWSCSGAVTLATWKKTAADVQARVNAVVAKELEYFDANRDEFQPAEVTK